MAALFALGVMSIGWMALIAALIATEKLLPWKEVANRGIAVILLVLGLTVAFAPEDVPGLTLPDSPEADQAMEAMGMEEETDDGDGGRRGRDGGGVDGRGRPRHGESMEEAGPAMDESMDGCRSAGTWAQASSGPDHRRGSACSTDRASST